MSSLEEEFNRVADEWAEGIKFHSLRRMMVKHPAHAKLLAFGAEAVPLVLRRLQTDHSVNWSLLLSELTGELPGYEPEAEGAFAKINVDALAEAWLGWGRTRGHIV
jgi:hypothetical protein